MEEENNLYGLALIFRIVIERTTTQCWKLNILLLVKSIAGLIV